MYSGFDAEILICIFKKWLFMGGGRLQKKVTGGGGTLDIFG